MSTCTYLLVAAVVVAVLMSRAECRPQTPETSEVEHTETFFLPGKFGSVVGEVLTYTDSFTVSKQNKRKKQEQNGPSASALVSGPAEASVGLSAGLTLVPSEAKVELLSAR